MGFGLSDVANVATGGAYGGITGMMDIADSLGGSSVSQDKAKNTETVQAAPRDADQQKMWDEFSTLLFGTPDNSNDRFDVDYYIKNNADVRRALKIDPDKITEKDRKKAERYYNSGRSFDADYYLKNNMDVVESFGIDLENITEKDRERAKNHWKKYGQYEGRSASDAQTFNPDEISKSYRDRLTEDIDFTKQADQAFIDSLSGFVGDRGAAGEKYESTIQGLMNDWQGMAKPVPIQLTGAGISGAPMQFTSRSQRDARDFIAGAGGTLNELANTNIDNQQQLAQTQNQFAHSYTPNRAENDYMNYLQGLNAQQDSLRYQTPTTISAGVTNPSLMSTFGTLASGAGNIASLIGMGGGTG